MRVDGSRAGFLLDHLSNDLEQNKGKSGNRHIDNNFINRKFKPDGRAGDYRAVYQDWEAKQRFGEFPKKKTLQENSWIRGAGIGLDTSTVPPPYTLMRVLGRALASVGIRTQIFATSNEGWGPSKFKAPQGAPSEDVVYQQYDVWINPEDKEKARALMTKASKGDLTWARNVTNVAIFELISRIAPSIIKNLPNPSR